VRPVRIRDGGQGEYGGRGHVIERPSRKGPAAGRVLPLEALDEGRAFPEPSQSLPSAAREKCNRFDDPPLARCDLGTWKWPNAG
jgi:hypothetical protein